MEFYAKYFNELTACELYEILKARIGVFIIEQEIRYQDLDDIDYRSLHCFLENEGKTIAYLRAFYADDEKKRVQIGRVLTGGHGTGVGRKLMEESLSAIREKMNPKVICCDAQSYCSGFYEKFGFSKTSEEFIEEGIPHVKMEGL